MSNPTANFNWQMPTNTDLVSQLPADFEVFGQAVDTSLMDLKGGTTGQVLKKNTNADMDFVWSSDATGMTNPMTTTGDTIYSSSGSTPARLGIGSSGQVLTVSGGVPAWVSPAGGGKVLQVVASTTSTEKSIASTSFTDTNLTVTITPSSASSRIMILASQTLYLSGSGVEFVNVGMRLRRASTTVLDYSGTYNQAVGIYTETVSGSTDPTLIGISPFTCVDSPATTSAITYTIQVAMSSTASRNAICQQGGSTSSIIALEIGA